MKPAVGDRLAALDAVRGIAAMMVVLFHFTAHYSKVFAVDYRPVIQLEWCYLGVNFFFMVSGFVIFMTLCRTVTGWDFVVSRLSRLYPAYWFAVALTATVVLSYGVPALARTPAQIAINFTMLQGFINVPHVDGVYWTLTYELMFYAWMYLLFRTRQLGNIEFIVGAWLALAAAAHLLRILGIGEVPWKMTFFMLLQYAHLFAAGILFYLVYSGKATRLTYGLLGLCVANQVMGAAIWVETAFVLGFFSVFLLISLHKARALAIRPLVFLGTISYTLYLLHENIGFVMLDALRRAGIGANLAVPVVIGATLVLAALVTLLIERPAMNAIRRWYKARRARASVAAT